MLVYLWQFLGVLGGFITKVLSDPSWNIQCVLPAKGDKYMEHVGVKGREMKDSFLTGRCHSLM